MQRCKQKSNSSSQMEIGPRCKILQEYFGYINKTQVQNENIGLLLNRKDEFVTNNGDKAQVLNSFFTSVITNSVGPQALETKSQVNANTEPLSVMEELLCELELHQTNPWALTIFS